MKHFSQPLSKLSHFIKGNPLDNPLANDFWLINRDIQIGCVWTIG